MDGCPWMMIPISLQKYRTTEERNLHGQRIMTKKYLANTWYSGICYKKIGMYGNCVSHFVTINFSSGLQSDTSI
jgi:hypothetical protein